MDIRQQNQPMLVSHMKQKDIRGADKDIREGKKDAVILLVPELCRCTGLTEDMRSNFRYNALAFKDFIVIKYFSTKLIDFIHSVR